MLLSQEQDLQYCKTHKQQHSVSLFGLFGRISTTDKQSLNSPCYCGALNKWKMSPDRLTMKWWYFSPPALSLPILVVCVFSPLLRHDIRSGTHYACFGHSDMKPCPSPLSPARPGWNGKNKLVIFLSCLLVQHKVVKCFKIRCLRVLIQLVFSCFLFLLGEKIQTWSKCLTSSM